jgi:uncharacterized protein (DUF362 family)
MDTEIFQLTSYEEVSLDRPLFQTLAQRIREGLKGTTSPKIVIKPNWIQESHEAQPDTWIPVITNPALICLVLEAIAQVTEGKAQVCICDAPHTYASFRAITERGGLRHLLQAFHARWPNISVEILDLRREVWVREEGVITQRLDNPKDPRGYARLNLGRDSLFFLHPGEGKYYGADYDSKVVNAHHTGEIQEYLIAGTPLIYDLFINLPKMKTHKKTGITCSLKNLVGINGDKNWLPHHTEGCQRNHGDEFPDMKVTQRVEQMGKRFGMQLSLKVPVLGSWVFRKARKAGKQIIGDSDVVIRNGNWAGNDTCWRMVLDLNRCLLYGLPNGEWREDGSTKPYLSIVDGIVGGEGNGPLCPDPLLAGVVLVGNCAAEVDAAAAVLMGFDPAALPVVSEAFAPHRWPLAHRSLSLVTVIDHRTGGRVASLSDLPLAASRPFRPHFGWVSLVGQPS